MRKASRLNRNMMFTIMAMGIIVLALVFGMFYYSFQTQESKASQTTAGGDTIIFIEENNQTNHE